MSRQASLFDGAGGDRSEVALADGARLLRARVDTAPVAAAIGSIVALAPLRRMRVPGGGTMAVAMTSCGALGWVSDARGYRYAPVDPESGRGWPAMPDALAALATALAAEAGYPRFAPDSCLVNRYQPGAGLALHQDRDERDFGQPIVSLSIGADATFLWGGTTRRAPVRRIALHDGDALVWGGASRLVYHGVAPLPKTGGVRWNLTFRRAG